MTDQEKKDVDAIISKLHEQIRRAGATALAAMEILRIKGLASEKEIHDIWEKVDLKIESEYVRKANDAARGGRAE